MEMSIKGIGLRTIVSLLTVTVFIEKGGKFEVEKGE
jgi:hypothetical protein